jgi:PRTRC genetic system protein C
MANTAHTARAFVYDGREFPDPDPRLSVEDVRKQMTEFFPELANADTREEKRADGTVVYSFSKRIGTKGQPGRAARTADPIRQRCADVVRIIRRVPEKRLRVFELAGQLLSPDGDLDCEAAADREPEVNLAIAEARAYGRATEQAVQALRRLPPR